MFRLHSACKRGNVDAVRRLLNNSDISINDRDVNGNTPLHIACQLGHLDVVTVILESGTDVQVHTKNMNGKEAIDLARANSHAEVINALNAVFSCKVSEAEATQGGVKKEEAVTSWLMSSTCTIDGDEEAGWGTKGAPLVYTEEEWRAFQAEYQTQVDATSLELKKKMEAQEAAHQCMLDALLAEDGNDDMGWGAKGAPLVYTEEDFRVFQAECQKQVDATRMEYKKMMEAQEAAHQRKLDSVRAELMEKVEQAEAQLARVSKDCADLAALVDVVEGSEGYYSKYSKAKLENTQAPQTTLLETTRQDYDHPASSAKQELEVLKEEHKAQLEAVHAECGKRGASFKEKTDSGFKRLDNSDSEAV